MVNNTVLITGGARRLGKAIALCLASEGMNVCIHYNTSGEQADSLASQIRKTGVSAFVVQADLNDEMQCENLMEQVFSLCGKIDVLINNASIFPPSGLLNFSFDDLVKNMGVNAYAPLVLCRKFALICATGNIINLLDSRVVDYDRQNVAYHLSKKALDAITKMLAVELAPAFRVNAVAPGLVLPPEGKDESYLSARTKELLLKKWGKDTDVADAVLFLVKSSFITGQTIFVDGGRHLRGDFYG